MIKKNNVIILLYVMFFIILAQITYSYGCSYPAAVHQYITNESKKVWSLDSGRLLEETFWVIGYGGGRL